MTAVNAYSPTTYFYVTQNDDDEVDSFVRFAMALADMPTKVLVASMSWGAAESEMPREVVDAFNNEAIKAGLRGATVFVSSGDDGANGNGASCGYEPSFPATSPYVTAVGATMATNWDGSAGAPNEQVCQADKGGTVTSGGGFSVYGHRPDWQTAAVDAYLSRSTAVGGYSTTGRGYPDVALAGENYEVVIGGELYFRRADMSLKNRGDAAAATWIFRGDRVVSKAEDFGAASGTLCGARTRPPRPPPS